MSRTARLTLWICISVLGLAVAIVLWGYARPINTPLRAGMTRQQVRLALESDPNHSYSFYSDPNWCSRRIFHLGELFSYHTWIGFTFDNRSRLVSVRGYHALTSELPIIGFHDHEFPQREIDLSPEQ